MLASPHTLPHFPLPSLSVLMVLLQWSMPTCELGRRLIPKEAKLSQRSVDMQSEQEGKTVLEIKNGAYKCFSAIT